MDDFNCVEAEHFGGIIDCRCKNGKPEIFFKKDQILVTCPYCGSYVSCEISEGNKNIDDFLMMLRMILHDWNDLQGIKDVFAVSGNNFPILKRCAVDIVPFTGDVYRKTIMVETYIPEYNYTQKYIQGINVSLSDTIKVFVDQYVKEYPLLLKAECYQRDTSEVTPDQVTKSSNCMAKTNEDVGNEKTIPTSEFSEEYNKLRKDLSHITEGFEYLRKELHSIWESLQ